MKEVYLSCYDSDIFYHYHNIKFYFSSVARRLRFIETHESFIESEKMKFRNKYHIKVEDESLKEMLAFIFYMKCEKRGFKAEVYDEKEITKTFYDLPTFNIKY